MDDNNRHAKVDRKMSLGVSAPPQKKNTNKQTTDS